MFIHVVKIGYFIQTNIFTKMDSANRIESFPLRSLQDECVLGDKTIRAEWCREKWVLLPARRG